MVYKTKQNFYLMLYKKNNVNKKIFSNSNKFIKFIDTIAINKKID